MKKRKKTSNNFVSMYTSTMESAIRLLDKEGMTKLVDYIWDAYKDGRNIYFIGNGGSASTASHMASDIGKNTINNYKNAGEKRMKTHSLSDNMSWITALGNDIGYDDIFVEQLKNFATNKDLLFVISGSGNSPNIIKTVMWAKKNGIYTVGMLGFDGGYVKDFLDYAFIVKSSDYGIVESIHSYIHHLIVESLKLRKKSEI